MKVLIKIIINLQFILIRVKEKKSINPDMIMNFFFYIIDNIRIILC